MYVDVKRQIIVFFFFCGLLSVTLAFAEEDTKMEVKDGDVVEGYSDAATGEPITSDTINDDEKTADKQDKEDDMLNNGPEPDFDSPNFDRHMRQTIAEEFGDPVPDEYTDKAYYYYYFKTHDEDKNSKLDKTELLKALIHLVLPSSNYQNYNRAEEPKEADGDFGIAWELELICRDSVDRIIRKDDKNKDGFLDAIEYQDGKSRGVKAIKKSIDKQLREHDFRGRFY